MESADRDLSEESEAGEEISKERELALQALKTVRSANMAEVSRRDIQGNFDALDELLGNVKTTLWDLSDALTARYFTNLTACRFTASS